MDIPEFDQSPGDILQEQEAYPAATDPIPTIVCEPVRSITLPAKSGGYRNYALTTTESIQVLGRDPRRKRAVLQVSDQEGESAGAFLGGTQGEALTGNAFLLALPGPAIAATPVVSTTLEITSMDEVWASALTADCTLSVINEQWAE